jgi:16S rRNA (guanine966-N2)-methyltransferase
LRVPQATADRGRLAGAVHSRNHDDERLASCGVEPPLQRREQLGDRIPQPGAQRRAIGEPSFPQLGEDGLGRRHAAIGLQQRGLQFLVGRLVEPWPREQLGDGSIEDVAGASEAGLEARRPRRRCYHVCVHSTRGKHARTPAGRLRIIGGTLRGRLLSVANRPGLRPTPDRVRETLFNWLGQRLDGLACLDLFAGSGALGFEAASRGATRVVMVERDRAAFAALGKAQAALQAPQVSLVHADALQYLRAGDERFDVVFLDPPFGQNALPAVFGALPARLAPRARVYVEAPQAFEPGAPWAVLRGARAGQVSYQLLQWDGEGTA